MYFCVFSHANLPRETRCCILEFMLTNNIFSKEQVLKVDRTKIFVTEISLLILAFCNEMKVRRKSKTDF